MTSPVSAELLRDTLAAEGPYAALALLNSQTNHRYTSHYRFDGQALHALTFFDRTVANASVPDDIPVEVSYCIFVRDTDRPFLLEDSLRDLRAAGHPKCRKFRSYYGVPVVGANGQTTGTLCHFDEDPVAISPELVRLTESLARSLAETKP